MMSVRDAHTGGDKPVQECNCHHCAIAERNRLMSALAELPQLLAIYAVVDPYAVHDPYGYDGGNIRDRIEQVRRHILTPNERETRVK